MNFIIILWLLLSVLIVHIVDVIFIQTNRNKYVAQLVKNPPTNAGDARDVGLIPGQEYPLQKEMAVRCSILVRESTWTEPGTWQPMGGRVEHDRICSAHTHTHTHTHTILG